MKRKPLPAPLPSRYQVLAIDQATTSGWAIFEVVGQVPTLQAYGTTKTPAQRKAVLALLTGPWVFAHESHGCYGFKAAVKALGVALGQWTEAIAHLAPSEPLRVLQATPQTWRAGLGLKSKHQAQAYAESLAGKSVKSLDACEAMCIGDWAVSKLILES